MLQQQLTASPKYQLCSYKYTVYKHIMWNQIISNNNNNNEDVLKVYRIKYYTLLMAFPTNEQNKSSPKLMFSNCHTL